jgi:hypothetical protein
MTGARLVIAVRIEGAHPGYRVWVSDEGWWYATRVDSRARGLSRTVCGANPDELADELSAEESAAVREHQAAIASPP